MTDVLVVCVAGTTGWKAAAQELAGSLARGGATVRLAIAPPPRRVRTFAMTDLVQAGAARRATMHGLARHQPRSIVYCSMTAALLWPRPGAVWLDSLADENRPGRHGVWQRVVERRRVAEATLLMTMSPGAIAAPAVVVPVPVDPSGPPASVRDIPALTYAGNPAKKRLEFVLSAWAAARRDREELVVAGIDGIEVSDGVRVAGRLPPQEYRALLRRTRVFVAAPTREDYGIAPLEALADGCMLATTPAPGPYPARDIARRLDPRLVADDLVSAVRAALDAPADGYAERARELLVPFTRAAVDRTVADLVLPRLLPT
jgi:hypothetical protein